MSADQDALSADEPHHKVQESIAQVSLSPAARRHKLLLWVFRQVMLCAFAWYFWDRAWMRWVFWIGVVFALINLAMILMLPRFLNAQRQKAERARAKLEALRSATDDE